MAADLTNGVLTDISSFIAAAAALGTAAFGLVDATKAFDGGVSRVGWKNIEEAVKPLIDAGGASGGVPAYGEADVLETLKANWLNGVAKPDQKAVAKSLIRLCLSPATAPALAAATGVDGAELTAAAQSIASGTALTPQNVAVLGRFDVVVSAILDKAYERADQKYRNTAKLCAAIFAIVLAVIGGWVLQCDGAGQKCGWGYLGSAPFWLACVIGAIATPLAPIAKDLASSLQAAVAAVSAWKR